MDFRIDPRAVMGECDYCKKSGEVYWVTLSTEDNSTSNKFCEDCVLKAKRYAEKKNRADQSPEQYHRDSVRYSRPGPTVSRPPRKKARNKKLIIAVTAFVIVLVCIIVGAFILKEKGDSAKTGTAVTELNNGAGQKKAEGETAAQPVFDRAKYDPVLSEFKGFFELSKADRNEETDNAKTEYFDNSRYIPDASTELFYYGDSSPLRYAFFDLDSNGTEELFVAFGSSNAEGNSTEIIAIFTVYNNEIVLLDSASGVRGHLNAYKNGIIVSWGSDGAYSHGIYIEKISDDGSKLEALHKFYVDALSGSTVYTDKEVEISKNTFEETLKKYLGMNDHEISSTDIPDTDIEFNWKLIDNFSSTETTVASAVNDNELPISKEEIVELFKGANNFFLGTLMPGWDVELDNDTPYDGASSAGAEMVLVKNSKYKTKSEIQDMCSKYFASDADYGDEPIYKFVDLYEMNNGKLYADYAMGQDSTFNKASSASITVAESSQNLIRFQITYTYFDGMDNENYTHSNNYTLRKTDSGWKFSGKFAYSTPLFQGILFDNGGSAKWTY